MAVYTKADYYATYSVAPRVPYTYPNGNTEIRRFTNMRLHYHPHAMKPFVEMRMDKILEQYLFTSLDRVVVFGSGFGWLCEELENRFGCSTIGIDPSPYILDNKDLSPDDELLEALTAAGYTTTEDPGKQIWEYLSQPGVPRTTANIVDYDLRKAGDKNKLIKEFGEPTHIITEEVWQTLTDEERTAYQAEFDNLGAISIHVIDGAVL